MQFVTVEVSSSVKPGFVVEIGGVDNKRVTIPTSLRVALPKIDVFEMLATVDGNITDFVHELRENRNKPRRLHDHVRVGHVHQTGYARHVAVIHSIELI